MSVGVERDVEKPSFFIEVFFPKFQAVLDYKIFPGISA
jgi:hypothetical protein